MKEQSQIHLINSTQLVVVKAFLGEIFWGIRAIRVAIEPDQVIVTVYHEKDLNDTEIVDLKFVEADIDEALSIRTEVKFRTVKVDSSEALPAPQREFSVYRRMER